MARHRIICTNQEPASEPHDVAHIESVGVTYGSDEAPVIKDVEEIREDIENGATYFTISESGEKAEVERYECGHCGYKTLRTNPDDQTDNNLDNLSKCNAR